MQSLRHNFLACSCLSCQQHRNIRFSHLQTLFDDFTKLRIRTDNIVHSVLILKFFTIIFQLFVLIHQLLCHRQCLYLELNLSHSGYHIAVFIFNIRTADDNTVAFCLAVYVFMNRILFRKFMFDNINHLGIGNNIQNGFSYDLTSGFPEKVRILLINLPNISLCVRNNKAIRCHFQNLADNIFIIVHSACPPKNYLSFMSSDVYFFIIPRI